MIDNVLDTLVRIRKRCDRTARKFDTEPFASMSTKLRGVIEEIDQSWCECFIGRHHTCVYIKGFERKRPGEFYSNIDVRGDRWAEYDPKAVQDEIFHRSKADENAIDDLATAAKDVFQKCRNEALPCFDAILATETDTTLADLREQVKNLRSHILQSEFAKAMFPSGSYVTTWHDQASGSINPVIPPHLTCKAWLFSNQSCGDRLKKLSQTINHAVQYLQLRHQMKGNTVAKTTGKIFFGHGRSVAWRELKDFLQDRLELDWDEFNRESTPGLSTKERLETMLDEAYFAFLVMTGEDEQADGSIRARENVIHEAGLFQGRLGFERAIILLEEGCNEFGNIIGVTQIRFPKGQIMSKSEEIRRVLEREGIIG